MTGGSILAGLLFIVWSQTQSLLYFYVTFAGIGFLQAAVLYTAAFAVIAKRYDQSKVRDNITTLTLWGGFASTLFIPLIELMMAYLSWRHVLIALGVINIFICAGIYQYLPRSSRVADGAVRTSPRPALRAASGRWALKQPIFCTLLVCFALFAVVGSSF